MIRSMTGFGRCEEVSEERKIIVEIKAVNHRYSDINIRLPKMFFSLEAKIKNIIKAQVERGKVDVFITYDEYTTENISVRYNESLAEEYLKTLERMKDRFAVDNDIRASSLSRYPEVLTLEEQSTNEDAIWPMLERVVKQATEQLVEARILEGKYLYEDLLLKLDEMNKCVTFIEDRSPQIVKDYYTNLKAKVDELLEDTTIDESILATTVAAFADKVCADEELVRLKSHISNMEQTLKTSEGIGRKLDFIAQEMNREANTIISKVNDLEVTKVAINLKTEIEKIREQIQNIE